MRDFQLFMIIILSMLLSGCGVHSDEKEELLSGQSLENAHYLINIPDNVILADDLTLSASSSIISVNPSDLYTDSSLNGDYTILALNFWDSNGSEPIPIMYLQAFELANQSSSCTIKICGEKYYLNQLETFIIYKDSDVVIYDFYNYIYKKPFQTVLKQIIDKINDSISDQLSDLSDWPDDRKKPTMLNYNDYRYLLDAEAYFEKNISNLITKSDSSETPFGNLENPIAEEPWGPVLDDLLKSSSHNSSHTLSLPDDEPVDP